MHESDNKTSKFKVERSASILRHSVTENIRNAILTGHFRPGERLPERELCEMTGVSRTLVREALRQLESEGLIKVIPYRGPFVNRLTPEQAEDIYLVREELEGLACKLFAERASAKQLSALKSAFDDLKKQIYGTPLEQLTSKNYFYEQLMNGAGNEALTNSLHLLNSKIMLLRSTSMQVSGRTKASLEELSDLINHLEASDGAAARAAGSKHVRNAALSALQALKLKQADTDLTEPVIENN